MFPRDWWGGSGAPARASRVGLAVAMLAGAAAQLTCGPDAPLGEPDNPRPALATDEPARIAFAAPRLPSGSLRGHNLLLVTIDTLRADAVGAYGGRRVPTPTLDRLSREGMRFDAAFAHAPMTLPSHASILTGRSYRMSALMARAAS